MSSLIIDGISTIKILDKDYETEFKDIEKTFPEYKDTATTFVLGGFGAYGNPSSFHNPLVKKLREKALNKVKQIFREYLQNKRPENYGDYKIECLFDRMMHRHIKQVPSAETAHRDVTPGKLLKEEDDDILFGGWINLSKHDQYFIGLPGSHLEFKNTYEVSKAHIGFCKLDIKSDDYKEYQKNKKKFVVKPGHIIIFPQHLLHEVLANKSENEQFRLFTGWRLTLSNTVLFTNKEQTIDNLDVPYIPSGQVPSIFSKMHIMYKNKEFCWVGKYKPIEKGTLLEWWDKNININISFNRNMSSLKDYNLDYEKYTQNQKKFMMTLHKLF